MYVQSVTLEGCFHIQPQKGRVFLFKSLEFTVRLNQNEILQLTPK